MTAVPQATTGAPAAPPPAPAPPGGPPPARAGESGVRRRTAPAPRTGLARLLPRTVAGRIRTLTTVVGVVLAVLVTVIWVAVGNARDGVRVIGQDAGPQVVATGDLYFQLTDMDAQLANALLIGRSQGPGGGREQALKRYDENRRKAGDALLEAAKLADETTEKKTAQDLLDAMGRYERLAGQALLLDEQSAHEAGPPGKPVTALYRQATDLMKLDLLPKAYNLTLDNGTLVRHTYEDERGAVRAGQVWTLAVGLLLLAALAGLQAFLTARFRRLVNPALALATLGTLVLVAASWVMLAGQADQLRKAKEDGFDSILALSRARAIGNSANADQTRYLLDPERGDTYEQVYLSKSQTVLYLPAGNLAEYNGAVQRTGPGPRKFKGFLGDEAGNSSLPRQPRVFDEVVSRYRTFQQDDHRIRTLVQDGRRGEAIASRSASANDFTAYDRSMLKLIDIHRSAFDRAVKAGDDGTSGWYGVLPAAGLVVLALVLAGVRPRLTEYR